MISFDRLVLVALREAPDSELAEVEEHVIGCTECAATLERLLDLRPGISAVLRNGQAATLAGPALVRLLESERRVTRRYRVPAGTEVACTVDASDVYTALHFELDLRGVQRVDFVYRSPSAEYRLEDLPFDPDAGEFVFAQPATYLRTLPTERKTITLVSVDEHGERVLGDFTLNHTAYAPG